MSTLHITPNPSGHVVISRAQHIAALNDDMRRNPFGLGKRTVVTRKLHQMGAEVIANVLRNVANYSDFNVSNNSHGERDFGTFRIDNHDIAFKIDYYDVDGIYGSEDPSDPAQTLRVMTLMFLSEY